jgi:hypothetical protein
MIPIAESISPSELGIADMKSFNQFISESVNISGDFNGTLIMGGSEPQQQKVEEEFYADIVWQGSLYRLKVSTENGISSLSGLSEQLQDQYPGAIVHQVYPVIEDKVKIKDSKRYHPAKLDWI